MYIRAILISYLRWGQFGITPCNSEAAKARRVADKNVNGTFELILNFEFKPIGSFRFYPHAPATVSERKQIIDGRQKEAHFAEVA